MKPTARILLTISLGAAACGDDTNSGPPKILSAYVLDQDPAAPTASGECDLSDPRSWGGDFKVLDERGNFLYLRCVPDLLNPLDSWFTFSYNVQLRVVFSEKLKADAVEDQQFRDGIVSAITADGIAVPVDRRTIDGTKATSQYDPAGADFKQGVNGTAPPGPAVVIVFGDSSNVTGLPSGTTTQVCFSTDAIVDSAGRHLVDAPPTNPRCVGVTTKRLFLGRIQPPLGQPIPADTLTTTGLQIGFNAPVPNQQLADATNFEIRLGTTTLPADCLSAQPDPTTAVTAITSLATILRVSSAPSCSVGSTTPISGSLTIKNKITDQYGAAFDGAMLFLTVTPMSGTVDGGADGP